jgi:hypothetical protein
MGRTVPTYRLALERMAKQWNDFKRALRKDDREAFESLVNRARMHASAATYAIDLDPAESAFLSMLLEHEKDLIQLKKERPSKEQASDGTEEEGEGPR